MLWPNARIRHARNVEVEERVAAVRRDNPECEAWLGLLDAALGESANGATWDAAVPIPATGRPLKAPVLWNAEITLNAGAARIWVRSLLKKLTPTVNSRRIVGLALLETPLRHDDARVDFLNATPGPRGTIDPAALPRICRTPTGPPRDRSC